MALSTGEAVAASNFADAMKTFYLKPLNDQIHRASVMLNRLETNSEDVSGNFAHLAMTSIRNPGVGSRRDTDATGPLLPEIGSQSYRNSTFLMAHHYARGGITGPVMRASKTESGAYAQALDLEMKGLGEAIPEQLNRQLWSYGHGRAATLSGADQTTSTLMVINSRAIFNAKINDRVHFSDITAGTGILPTNGTTIVAINRDVSSTTHTIELAAASGGTLTTADDAMYFGANSGGVAAADSSRAAEMFGIPAAIDDGALGADEGLGGASTVAGEAAEFIANSAAYGGVERTVAAGVFYRSTVLQNPSTAGTLRSLTVPLMEQGFLNCITVGGAKEGNLDMYSTPGLWATFGLLHIGDRIFNDFKETLEGGWIALKYNGRPFFFDRDCPRHAIWFLDMSTLILMAQSGYEFMERDGAIMRAISNRDAYEFTMYRDAQLGCRRPKNSTKLMDLATSFNVENDV